MLALQLSGGAGDGAAEAGARPGRIAVRRRERPEAFAAVVGESKRMADVFETARKVASGNATVLILGESGTGKELVARAIHEISPRRSRSFVAVNCPSIPRDLLESELFGYEKGAFTGAEAAKRGRLELADGGTLFLDELGDLSFGAQAKLLRVLQERTFERLGGLETLTVDVRILAATSVDLAAAVAERRFREDLYYRLNVVPIVMPALRDRAEDVPALVEHFLTRYAIAERPVRYVTPEALRRLTAYPWPGNVRELENAIQYAVNLMEGDTLRPTDLPRAIRSWSDAAARGGGSLRSEMDRVERDLIVRALEDADWNRSEAARRLGTNESRIRQRMKKHGIVPPRTRRA
jgi:two-component system response regulator AtoC